MITKKVPASFSDIYESLINELSLNWIWKYATPAMLGITAIAISYYMGVATSAKILTAKPFDYAIALLVFFIILAILFSIFFGVVTNILSAFYKPEVFVAKIIITLYSPFRKTSGLSYKDLQHLKSIGQNEQSAAGWQGGLFSIAIVWFLSENLGLATDHLQLLIDIAEKTSFIRDYSLSVLGWTAIWVFICLFEVFIAYLAFKYLYGFLAYEPSNRTIIRACEDALALLEDIKLASKKNLAINDKRLVAKSCQCLYIPAEKKANFSYRLKFSSFEENNKEFFLLSKPVLKELSSKTSARKKRPMKGKKKNG